MVFSMSLEGRLLQLSLIGRHLGESPPVISERAGLLKVVVLMVAEELVCWDAGASCSTEGDGLDTGIVGHEDLRDSVISSSFPQKCLVKVLNGVNNTSFHLLH